MLKKQLPNCQRPFKVYICLTFTLLERPRCPADSHQQGHPPPKQTPSPPRWSWRKNFCRANLSENQAYFSRPKVLILKKSAYMVLSHQVGVQKHDKMKLMAISAGTLCSLGCDYINLIVVKIEQLFCYEMKSVVTLCDFFHRDMAIQIWQVWDFLLMKLKHNWFHQWGSCKIEFKDNSNCLQMYFYKTWTVTTCKQRPNNIDTRKMTMDCNVYQSWEIKLFNLVWA